jgi:hypothetical protein
VVFAILRPFTHLLEALDHDEQRRTNSTARQVEAIIPVNTVMLIDLRAPAPAPVAITSGTTDRMKATTSWDRPEMSAGRRPIDDRMPFLDAPFARDFDDQDVLRRERDFSRSGRLT